MTERYPALFDPSIGHTLVRRLIAATLGQAVLDARTKIYRRNASPGALSQQQQDALIWLNAPGARQMAEWIDLVLPEKITFEFLRQTATKRLRPQQGAMTS
jgi:hypothetical protein